VVRERGVLLALAGLIAGILAGEHAGPARASPALALGITALLASWFVHGPARLALAVVALALLGGALTQRALDGQAHSTLTDAIARREHVAVEAVLVDDPDPGRFDTDALVRVPAGGSHRTLLAVATGDDAQRLAVLEASDHVVLDGRLAPLRANRFDGRARRRHAIGRIDDVQVLALRPARGAFGLANRLRRIVLRGTEPLPPTPRGLLAGFLLGDTRAIPDDVVADYRDSGLSHLLAVSGANVAFTLALFGPLLRRLALGPRTVAALAIVLMFATMTRFEPSVLRASAMAVVALVAGFTGRPASGVRALTLAVIGLLVLDPFLLHSIGFWLSCGASAGIVLLSAPLRVRLRGPAWIRDPLAVSCAAQAGVTPVLLATFGTVPVVTPVANLLAAPAAEAVGVYGTLASVVGGIVPPLAPLLQQPTATAIAWISMVARVGASVGVTLDRRSAWLVLAGIASAACLRRFRRSASARATTTSARARS
jgi:competence protein ComEC